MFGQNGCQGIIMKGFLSWRRTSGPGKTLLITWKQFESFGVFFCCFVRALRGRAQYIKVFWFFKSCRPRREPSNALVESFWEAVLVDIWPFQC